jgi:hypothetical protein
MNDLTERFLNEPYRRVALDRLADIITEYVDDPEIQVDLLNRIVIEYEPMILEVVLAAIGKSMRESSGSGPTSPDQEK